MRYQPEIDGLRAISVLAVLFYHLGANWIPGGFTGVDIFFVISGFLITGIIKKNIEHKCFSFLDFYARRIRRIFPALISVLIATTAIGFFILAPGDYDAQGRSAISAALSVSNIYFFFNTGYFDNAAETLPLLHTWSLGVEEQFYVALPILIVALSARKTRKFIFPLLTICVVAILFISTWKVALDQKAAFYLTYYRAWELGAGALLAYIPFQKNNFPAWLSNALPALGILLIGYSIFSYHPNGSFPGYGALPSVMGAALVLAFTGKKNSINRILSTPPLVFIGKISYSLYLWHWPLIVYWRHYTSGAPITTLEQSTIGILSIFIGYLSWRWIETPFRHAKTSQKKTIMLGACGMLLACVPAAFIVASSGLPDRIPDEYSDMQSKEKMWNWACPEDLHLAGNYLCSVGAPWKNKGNKAFIVGDSHAQHMLPLLDEAGRKTNTAIAQFGTCPPIFRPQPDGLKHFDPAYLEGCHKSRSELFELLARNKDVKTVILAGLWPMIGYTVYKEKPELDNVIDALNTGSTSSRLAAFSKGSNYIEEEVRNLATELEKSGRRLIIISDIPTFESRRDPIPCFLANATTLIRRACNDGSERVSKADMEAFQLPMAEIFRRLGQESPKIQVVIPTDYLCRAKICDAYVNGTYIYRDTDHLRRNMPREIYSILSDRIGLTSALSSSTANSSTESVVENHY